MALSGILAGAAIPKVRPGAEGAMTQMAVGLNSGCWLLAEPSWSTVPTIELPAAALSCAPSNPRLAGFHMIRFSP